MPFSVTSTGEQFTPMQGHTTLKASVSYLHGGEEEKRCGCKISHHIISQFFLKATQEGNLWISNISHDQD